MRKLIDATNFEVDPYTGGGLWSIITFSWLNPLLKKGYKGKLKAEDIPPIPETETAKKAFMLFDESFRDHTNGGSLAGAIAVFAWRSLALNAIFAEDGGNWSIGQRQLLCLTLMLIQKRRILVLDEATTSVDTAIENVIQKAIKEDTKGFTVITVARRVPTVISIDFVLVLREGKIPEYDSPTKLLEHKSSSFSKLVMEFTRRSNSGV